MSCRCCRGPSPPVLCARNGYFCRLPDSAVTRSGTKRSTRIVFAIYLIDVCGHGVSAAMHSVSVLNVLRQHALPATDFKDPVQVLSALNVMFQMDRHDDQYFTMWYGVYDTRERTLTHASAGHHPGYPGTRGEERRATTQDTRRQ